MAEERFRQLMFASAFGAFDRSAAMKQYGEAFEKQALHEEGLDYEVEEFEPETEDDVTTMLNAARRAGVIT